MNRADIRALEPQTAIVPNEINDLAREAYEILGYAALSNEIQSRILDDVLADLDIQALNPEDVEKYQKEKIRELEHLEHQARKIKKSKIWIRVALCAFALASLCLGLTIASYVMNFHRLQDWAFGSTLLSAFLGALSMFQSIPTTSYRWQTSPIRGRTEHVPEFAIAKAIAIQKRLPGAQIFVVELLEIKDPFLKVVLGTRERYFEVYEEQEFETKL